MNPRFGSIPGLDRKATILKINKNNGKVVLSLDEAGIQNQFQIESILPSIYCDNNGSFFGFDVKIGTTVLVRQIHGGEWYISAILPPDGFFSGITYSSYLEDLKSGRILAQVNNKVKWFLDPNLGFNVGDSKNYLHVDPNLSIFSHHFSNEWIFSQARRKIEGIVKRDLSDNSIKNNLESPLESHAYDKNLVSIGMDPLGKISLSNEGAILRNPPFVEDREIIYEFSNEFRVLNESNEILNYQGNSSQLTIDNRYELRSNVISLSLNYPNHLLEIIKGTVVDTFGNIIDINRNILPLGKDNLSLKDSSNKSETFINIKKEIRKSLAYHFELNSRKSEIPDLSVFSDFGRNRSNFFFDLDKEGTFKLNVPASSETGNVHLHTRYNNYSDLLSSQDTNVNPLSFVKSENGQDIFLTDFNAFSEIKITGSDSLDGYRSPSDYRIDKPIKLGTVYHDITKTGNEFLKSANYLKAGMQLVNFHPGSRLNEIIKPLEKIVSSEIIVSGTDANAGGRSGDISLDGFLSLNIGANTIDKQSLWLDCQGGVVANYGRDKNNISYMGSFDGDVLLQIGGETIDSSLDSRFQDLQSTYRNGTFELRVVANGQIYIIRVASEGIHLVSPGTITLDAQQSINLRSNGNIFLQGESIVCYPEGPGKGRIINRAPPTSIG